VGCCGGRSTGAIATAPLELRCGGSQRPVHPVALEHLASGAARPRLQRKSRREDSHTRAVFIGAVLLGVAIQRNCVRLSHRDRWESTQAPLRPEDTIVMMARVQTAISIRRPELPRPDGITDISAALPASNGRGFE